MILHVLSIGLSGLNLLGSSIHSPALRFGLCWYRNGLSGLVFGMAKPAPKEHIDTSIAQRAMTSSAPLSKGLKDRPIPAPAGRHHTNIARRATNRNYQNASIPVSCHCAHRLQHERSAPISQLGNSGTPLPLPGSGDSGTRLGMLSHRRCGRPCAYGRPTFEN